MNRFWLAAWLTAVGMTACDQDTSQQLERRAKDLRGADRIHSDEPRPGREKVFALDVPPELKVTARFADRAQLSARLPLADVSALIQEQLTSGPPHLEGNSLVFSAARFKNDSDKRQYRIVVTERLGRCDVLLADETPPPVTQGLSNEERWQRAGRNPDGTQKNRLQIY